MPEAGLKSIFNVDTSQTASVCGGVHRHIQIEVSFVQFDQCRVHPTRREWPPKTHVMYFEVLGRLIDTALAVQKPYFQIPCRHTFILCKHYFNAL